MPGWARCRKGGATMPIRGGNSRHTADRAVRGRRRVYQPPFERVNSQVGGPDSPAPRPSGRRPHGRRGELRGSSARRPRRWSAGVRRPTPSSTSQMPSDSGRLGNDASGRRGGSRRRARRPASGRRGSIDTWQVRTAPGPVDDPEAVAAGGRALTDDRELARAARGRSGPRRRRCRGRSVTCPTRSTEIQPDLRAAGAGRRRDEKTPRAGDPYRRAGRSAGGTRHRRRRGRAAHGSPRSTSQGAPSAADDERRSRLVGSTATPGQSTALADPRRNPVAAERHRIPVGGAPWSRIWRSSPAVPGTGTSQQAEVAALPGRVGRGRDASSSGVNSGPYSRRPSSTGDPPQPRSRRCA